MPLLRDRCICLRKVEYSETSQILTLFAREHGIIRLIAKGAHRRTKVGAGKFDGGIDLLDEGDAVFSHAPARDLPPLTEWSLRDGHLALRKSLRGIYLGAYAAELVVHLIEEHDAHPELFDLLLNFLSKAASAEQEAAFLYFQVSLLREAGFQPRISGCASCGRSTEERGPELFMSPMLGGRVCFDCAPSVPDHIGIRPRLLRLLNTFALGTFSASDSLPALSRQEADPLNHLLARHVEQSLSLKMRMTPYILAPLVATAAAPDVVAADDGEKESDRHAMPRVSIK